MADLYPTYGRQYQRQDSSHSHYQLAGGSSTSPGIMYPPQLLTQTAAVADDQSQTQQTSQASPTQQQHEHDSVSPASQTASSPKQESPTGPKSDGVAPQPSKPQATFLTKLYASVALALSAYMRVRPCTDVRLTASSSDRRTIT